MTEIDEEERWQKWTDDVQEKWEDAAKAAEIDPWLIESCDFDSAYEDGLSPAEAIMKMIKVIKEKTWI